MTGARLAAVRIGGSCEPWEALGFATDAAGRIPLRNGALEFTGADSGMSGLVVDATGVLPDDIEGVALHRGDAVPAREHPNGALEIDHLVLMSASLERSSEAIEAALGLPCKRVRETETVRQAFHRFADETESRGCIIEIVENARVGHTSLFGLVVNVVDLDAVCERWGSDVIGTPKAAVQPGRRIATVRAGVGLGVPLAFMTPDR